MSAITTHVLDTASGCPGAGIDVVLEQHDGEAWRARGRGRTNDDGRVTDLLADDEQLEAGGWRLRFALGAWAAAQNRPCFHPRVTIEFDVVDATQHYHVPLLWSPFGYSTYRGS